jgi:hypothetical protein
MDCPGSLAHRGRPHMQLGWPAAKSRARGGVRGPQPCLSTRGLAMSARRDRLQTRGAARGDAEAHNVPCKRCHGSTAGSHTDSSHGDGGLRGMSGPGAPHSRGAAVLRLDGQHSGIITCRRISMPPEHPGRDQGGGEIKAAATVLTLGRRCSRDRLSVVVHVGVVDVPGDGVPSAPAPLYTPNSRLHGTTTPVPAAPASVHARPPVSPAWRGDGVLSSFSSSFPSSLPSAVEQRKGENPKCLVESQQGLGSGV